MVSEKGFSYAELRFRLPIKLWQQKLGSLKMGLHCCQQSSGL